MDAVFPTHLAWITEHEARGQVFLTGPLEATKVPGALSGLTVYRLGSLEEAQDMAASDPFVREGVMSVEVTPWQVVGGAIVLRLRLSQDESTLR